MGSRRMHHKDAIHLITNRCEEGFFLMIPSRKINEIIQYWFARALVKHGNGLEVYSYCFLSNHFHMQAKDTEGTLAEFMWFFEGNVAKAINEHLGRTGAHFWQGHYDDQIIEGERTFWKKYFYVLANAVKSGLVNSTKEWIGWNSLSMALTEKEFSITGLNKTRFHNSTRGNNKKKKTDKEFQDTFTFKLAIPPMLEDKTKKERRKIIKSMLKQAEKYYISSRKNKRPLGVKKVLQQVYTEKPKRPSKRPKKRFACDTKKDEIMFMKIYREFVHAYKTAYVSYRSGALFRYANLCNWPSGCYPPSCIELVVITE